MRYCAVVATVALGGVASAVAWAAATLCHVPLALYVSLALGIGAYAVVVLGGPAALLLLALLPLNGVFLLLGGFAPNRRQLRRTSAARFALLGLNAQTLHHWLLFGRAAANSLAEKAAARESEPQLVS